jgi:hypothetical protein
VARGAGGAAGGGQHEEECGGATRRGRAAHDLSLEGVVGWYRRPEPRCITSMT